ncbi:hypothetical protein C7A07_09955 [Pseudomonas fragi]|nr:hypothetical protein [Pseudomonas fragi]PAA06852.1 hypothetical protein CJU78_15720 [Pseudomonas fragi]PRW98611.1 hypothetical protein C7A07_09955 [Pseudomonas fragi]
MANQARSSTWNADSRLSKKPRLLRAGAFCVLKRHKTCGSWLACDAGASVCQTNRGDAVASKPAPTKGPVNIQSLIAQPVAS